MIYELTGRLHAKTKVQKISEKFSKLEFVVETTEKYPQLIKIEAVNDNTALLKDFKKNDDVKVQFVINGRAWENPEGETKYFTTLKALGIAPETNEVAMAVPSNDEDLPF